MTLIKYMNNEQLLRWHLECGVDETILNTPVNRLKTVENKDLKLKSEVSVGQSKTVLTNSISNNSSPGIKGEVSAPVISNSVSSTLPPSIVLPSKESCSDDDLSLAVNLAQNAKTIEDLRLTLEVFDGCALKKTATNLVFIDGNTKAKIMLLGEGPGSEEDRKGIPFVGASGKLLDQMLLSVGLDRKEVLISNSVFWRPPGNRSPTSQELAICLPFVERMIQLVRPKIIVALGGSAAKILLAESASIGRLRGKWFSYSSPGLSSPIEATAMFHPAYLLRSPAQKRNTWKDWQVIKSKLDVQ